MKLLLQRGQNYQIFHGVSLTPTEKFWPRSTVENTPKTKWLPPFISTHKTPMNSGLDCVFLVLFLLITLWQSNYNVEQVENT